MQKTDLGFFLISDEEYYALKKPEKDMVYVLVNSSDEYFLVLKNGQFMGKIDRGLKEMKFTQKAVAASAESKFQTSIPKPMLNVQSARNRVSKLQASESNSFLTNNVVKNGDKAQMKRAKK